MSDIQAGVMPKRSTKSSQVLLVDASGTVLGFPSCKGEATILYNHTVYGHVQDRVLRMGFNGEFPEAAGFYMLGNGYRPCSTALKRFYSPDHWTLFDKGGLNAYCYCGGGL